MPVILKKKGVREQKVADVMHPGFIAIKSGATLTDAIWKMMDAGVSCLIVEPREKGDAYGIITRRDIVDRAVTAGPKRMNFSEHKVYELMTKPLVTVSSGLKVKYAARLMQREQVRRLPVFDGERIVGMISNSDIFDELIDHDAFSRPRNR